MAMGRSGRFLAYATTVLVVLNHAVATMGPERVVFQTTFGDIEFGMLPEYAPITAQHIFKLAAMGCYIGNHFFRVDKGFVAQVADVQGGRLHAMNEKQKEEAVKKVPLEVTPKIKHTFGVLSMGRYDDPNSGGSSFSILLGDAPHLDMQYTIFAKMTAGEDALAKMQQVETRTEGIFVMPKERITIHATYVYLISRPVQLPFCHECDSADSLNQVEKKVEGCADELTQCQSELHTVRHKCLPGT